MRLELEILDGINKGKRLLLRNGLRLGKTQDGLFFDDPQMSDFHATVTFDNQKSWNIECLAPLNMRMGFQEVQRATLIPGLIFHLGQTGFKVIERQQARTGGPWIEEMKAWLNFNPGRQIGTEIFLFLRPVRLSFIQGPQYEEIFTLSYGPRELGYNNLDLSLKDPSSPPRVVKFFQVGDQVYIESLCGDKVTVNGATFDQHLVLPGDILRITSSAIELSILS
jgi:hypothetical protein